MVRWGQETARERAPTERRSERAVSSQNRGAGVLDTADADKHVLCRNFQLGARK